MRGAFDRLISRLDMTKQRISEIVDFPIETLKMEKKKEQVE